MRVVVDTNILVYFAILPSAGFERLFDHIAEFGVTLVSKDTIAELYAVLTREKFRRYISLDSAMDYVDWYVGISETVIISEKISACRDPRDDKFLEVATSGLADAMLSGDTDLLALHPFRGIPIVRPSDFWRIDR